MVFGRAVWLLCATTAAVAGNEIDLSSLMNSLGDAASKGKGKGKGKQGKGRGAGPGAGAGGMDGLLDLLGGMQDGGKKKKTSLCKPDELPVPKMDHHEQMTANGCGPQGLQIQEQFGLYKCCNGHDVCFSVCGTTHQFCETEFKNCMKKVCQKPLSGSSQECNAQANTFSSLTASFGVGFHAKSQELSCECLKKGPAVVQRHRDYLQGFFRQYNESQSTDEMVDETMERWKGKEADLYYHLVKTYGSQFVTFSNIEPDFHHDEL